MVKKCSKVKFADEKKKASPENTEDRPSNSRLAKRTKANRTLTQSNNLGISFDPRREIDFEEDESREIANQIRSRTVFLVKVTALKVKDEEGSLNTLDDSSPYIAVLEAHCKSASKRWQMKKGSHYVIDVEGLSLSIWLADKISLSYEKVSMLC